MAYTPINWQTGDTITAEKLNKMDNGWGTQETQLFSETVTVSPTLDQYRASLEYFGTEYPDTLLVTFNGTDYECPRFSPFGGLGSGDQYKPTNVSNLFYINVGDALSPWSLWTYASGTYSVSAVGEITQTSSEFAKAVRATSDTTLMPLPCIDGITTTDEFGDAFYGGSRLVYVPLGSESGTCHIVTGAEWNGDDATLTLLPAPDGFTATFTNGVFAINWS